MQEAACHNHGAYSMSMAQKAVLTTRKEGVAVFMSIVQIHPKDASN